ncbi:MAG: hypothetical protein AAF744_11375 [Pseudomonadota bacterium]
MFRFARIFIFIGMGFVLGFDFKDTQLSRLCTDAGGTWTGSTCQGAERQP